MIVHIPPAIKDMSPMLSEFFDGMVFKLNVNSHKDAIRGDDIDGLLDKMAAEIQEFKEQRLADASDPNILSELNDISNFAFLLYAFLRSRGVMDLKERFIREYYHVDVDTGKVYCAKTRAGSPFKVGDRIFGVERGGVRYIRAQHTASGASISVAIRDVVWWTAYGQWPIGKLSYLHQRNPRHTIGDLDFKDAIKNLVLEVPAKEYPYVSLYAPKGREGAKNWGKFVYQRRHRLKLVRVGYWDSKEEAAREGLKAWKEKTRV